MREFAQRPFTARFISAHRRNRLDLERPAGLLDREDVLLHRPGTAARAAESGLADVEVQEHLGTRHKRRAEALLPVAMTRELEILPVIVERLHEHRLGRRETHALPVLRGELNPADIRLAAVVLGTHVVLELVRDRRRPAPEERSRQAVDVVLARTAPVVLERLQGWIEPQGESKPRQRRRHRAVRRHRVLDGDRAVRRERPDGLVGEARALRAGHLDDGPHRAVLHDERTRVVAELGEPPGVDRPALLVFRPGIAAPHPDVIVRKRPHAREARTRDKARRGVLENGPFVHHELAERSRLPAEHGLRRTRRHRHGLLVLLNLRGRVLHNRTIEHPDIRTVPERHLVPGDNPSLLRPERILLRAELEVDEQFRARGGRRERLREARHGEAAAGERRERRRRESARLGHSPVLAELPHADEFVR